MRQAARPLITAKSVVINIASNSDVGGDFECASRPAPNSYDQAENGCQAARRPINPLRLLTVISS